MPFSKAITSTVLLASVLATPAWSEGQADMGIKAQALFEAADATLNQQWKATYDAMKQLDATYRGSGNDFAFATAALDSQRAWQRLRDQQCSIEGAIFKEGSMAPMVEAQCRERMTRERTEDLKALLVLAH